MSEYMTEFEKVVSFHKVGEEQPSGQVGNFIALLLQI